MARRMLTRKVTFTTVKVAKITRENGVTDVVDLPDVVLIGNRSLEQAQRIVDKEHYVDQQAQVVEVQADTKEYEMPIEEFIQVAKVKEEKVGQEVEVNA